MEITLEQALAELSTDNQRAFVQEYLIDLNATQAAIRAGYSADSARQEGSRLLSNAAIQKALELAKLERSKRTEISADKVLRELARIGFSSMRDFSKWGPAGVQPIDSATLSDDDAACIAEVSETITESGGSIKVKLHDKVGALEKIGRHLGLWGKESPDVNINLLTHVTDADLDARIAKRLPKEKNDGPQSPEPPREDGTPGAS